MNLRQHTTQAESAETTKSKTAHERAWYLPPEPTQEPETQSQPPAAGQALFDPVAAERILARAGALQEVHGQMLSQGEIEAVAAELGIKLEFVQLAIEQERIGVAAPPVPAPPLRARSLTGLRVVTTILSCTLVAEAYAAVSRMSGKHDLSPAFFILSLCVFPLLLSSFLGVIGQSRRWGAASGLAIAAVAISFCIFPNWRDAIDSEALRIFMIAIVSSMTMGALGAQGRRVVSRRAARKRSERVQSATTVKSA